MKRLLLPLLAALVFPGTVNAEISDEIHNRCKDVSDYVGCVKANEKKEVSIYDGLSKKERNFLKEYLRSPSYVSTINGNWVLFYMNKRSGDASYVDINSLKKVGKLLSIKRCNILGSSNKKVCDNPRNTFPGGTSIRLFNCKKRLYFSNELNLDGSLYRASEWKSIDKSRYNFETAKIACKY
jgi:hypothetical protein